MEALPFGGTFSPEAARAAETGGLARYAMAVETPYGLMALVQRGEWLTELRFGGELYERETLRETRLLHTAAEQLAAYFAGKRTAFDLPLAPLGTAFQAAVWRALVAGVPYGQTVTYGELARRAGSPAGARAVGMANHANPLPIVIPCHRVIGTGGRLVGYGGGLPLKTSLLRLEGAAFRE